MSPREYRQPLSEWRYRLALAPAPPELSRPTPLNLPASSRAKRLGETFRNIRLEYQLQLDEVADGWGVPATVIGELERGLREFPEAADFKAATDQLYLWFSERHGQRLVKKKGS